MYTVGQTSSSIITGLASGIDTDNMVSEIMMAEKIPLDNLDQEKQLEEWKMEAYRECIDEIKSFESNYFDVLNPTSNMLSESTYEKYDVNCTDSSVVKITANADAEPANYTIQVNNLATSSKMESSVGITKEIEGTSPPDFTSAIGQSFEIKLDSTTRTITIDGLITDIASFKNAINEAVGEGKIVVSDTNGDGTGALMFNSVLDSGVQEISINSNSEDVLNDLGFGEESNLSNTLNISDSLVDISSQMNNPFTFNLEGNVVLTINGENFEFDEDTCLNDMIDEINNSDAGVIMKYNNITDQFTFTAKETGAGNTLDITETDSTFLTSANFSYIPGEDAEVIIDGQKLTRSTNTYTIEGVTHTLLQESAEVQNVSITHDIDDVFDTIVQFVNDYNNLIEMINNKLDEEYDSDYPPLTEDQKSEMSEDEIETWEEQATVGLLSNDPILEGMVDAMRLALYEPVEGLSLTLPEIGITTSSNYYDNGKLVIDETMLREAIQKYPDGVMDLFSQESTSYPGTSAVVSLNGEEPRRKV